MSHSHLPLAERIGIEAFIFGATGRVPGALPDALARHHSTISSKLRQGGSRSGQIRLRARTADCRAMTAA